MLNGDSRPFSPQRPGKPLLAVKPFDNVGADAKQDEFADGITHGIIAALTRLPRLTIIEDGSPSMHKSRKLTVQELGRQFDVRYVLKGGLRKLGDRVRVTAELTGVYR